MKILVVEDEQAFIKAIRQKLTDHGFEVDVAENTEQALEKLSNNKYDAVWTDHYMPGKSGIELVTEVKSREELKDLPVYVISNTADGDDMYSYIQLGVTEYFVKSESRLDDIIADIKKSFSEKTA